MVIFSTRRWTRLPPFRYKSTKPSLFSLYPVVPIEKIVSLPQEKAKAKLSSDHLHYLTAVKQKAFKKKSLKLNWEFLVFQRWKSFLVTWRSKCNSLTFYRLGKQGFIYIIFCFHLSYTKIRTIFPSFFQ